ncbi:MAG: serine--tRNA ligase, partial [Thermodesulfovibrionales bacterium]
MLDIRFIRENQELVENAIKNRNEKMSLSELVTSESKKREILKEVEDLRNRRNTVSDEISRLKKDKKDASALISEMKTVSDKIKEFDADLRQIDEEIISIMLMIPNIPHDSVPVGTDEEDNVEVRKWGTLRDFDFEPLNHWDIAETLDIIDFERASKLAGSRFSLMKGLGAKLERSLMNFMLDHNTALGYKEIFPPILVNRETMTGTGQLPKFESDLFKTADPDFYLIPTAEVPVTNIYANEILNESELPMYFTAFTPCFRREAGSHGKDTRGLIRQHQFNKVELVKITDPETSYDELDKLTADAEDVLQKLDLPYRTVVLCTGDIGFAAAKTYDIEVWLPGQQKYREISSCSNCEDFQARRAKIRFRREGKKGTEFVHTLNGSGLAIGR